MGSSSDKIEKLYPCPCCGYLVHERNEVADSCRICGWQNVEEQLKDPYLVSAPNEESLWRAQRNYLRSGDSKGGKTRKTHAEIEHIRDQIWRPVIDELDDFGSPTERQQLCVADYSQLYYWSDNFWNFKAKAHSTESEPDVDRAHDHSIFNRSQIARSTTCGCFYCCEIFPPTDIDTWTDDGLTPLCPKCSIDSIIGSSSGYPITTEFLTSMRNRWF